MLPIAHIEKNCRLLLQLNNKLRCSINNVQLCSAPLDISWLKWVSFLKHGWLKTSSKEAGMGLVGCSDLVGNPLGQPTAICPANRPGNCQQLNCNVDEDCVNNELILDKPLGPWGPLNNCWSFAGEVINKCLVK